MTLEVGESKMIFRAHRDLLRSKSKFFEGCLGCQFSEAVENKVLLKEDSPKAVAAFLDWLYDQSKIVDLKGLPDADLAPIYCFADKVSSESYHNQLMDAVRKHCMDNLDSPTHAIVELADAGLVDSPLVNFLIDGWAFDMMTFPQAWIDGKLEEDLKSWSLDSEVVLRLLRSIWEMKNSPTSLKPSKRTGCHYHNHASGSTC